MRNREPMVSVRGLRLKLANFELRKVTFDVYPGEYFVLLGPTGSGKTVLIESLCGLHTPDDGTIHINGRNVTHFDPADRGIGYVPQDYALLPFKTVEENIAFGLEARRMSDEEIAESTEEMLDLLDIGHLAMRYPGKLSGGERQRVALGRALVTRPSVLLLDEPFSAIDEGLRGELRQEIRELQQRLGIVTIHICHSLEEAICLGDRLSVIRAGSIVQTGAPNEILNRPRDLFMARFLRLPNLIQGEVRVQDGKQKFFVEEMLVREVELPPGPATAVIPFEQMSVSRIRPVEKSSEVVFETRIASISPASFRPELHLNGVAKLTIPGIFPANQWSEGSDVFVSLPREAIHVLPGI